MAKKGDGIIKTKIKGMAAAAISFVVSHSLIILIPTIIAVVLVTTVLDYVRELVNGSNSAQKVYEAFESENLNQLVEKKGNDQDGYYWGFVDDIDARLDKVVEKLDKDSATISIHDKELLKKMIKAELITQYPDLGGKSFSNSNSSYSGSSDEKAKQLMRELTLEEKISQMLFVSTSDNNKLSQNAGGYILEDGFDFSNAKSSIDNASNRVDAIFAVNEEGGTVQRALTGYPDARYYGDNQDYIKLQEDSTNKAKSLLQMGINMNLAPVADVSDVNSFMGKRSFSNDYTIASTCVETAVKFMKQEGLVTNLKHFPGYSNVDDAHIATYEDTRDKEHIQADINVFKKGIDTGAPTVTVSHTKVNAIDSENPACLSSKVVEEIRDLGFSGVIMTDSIDMQVVKAYSNRYVKAIEAGIDVLEVTNFSEAKKQIMDAVDSGKIEVTRINESVQRILALKFEYGLIKEDNLQMQNSIEGGDQNVCYLALSQVDKPYIVAGADENGFDCSGLIVWAYQKAGYDWGGARLTADGFSKKGRQITKQELKPGDLICEGWDGSKFGHIVIYVGNNEVVGAEAVCSLPWNEHISGACSSGCKVRKRAMTDEEANGTNGVKYVTLSDFYTGSADVYQNSSFVKNFLTAAQEITDYVKQNDFAYGNAEYMPPREDGTTNSDGSKHISCDRLVSWALYKCGYTDQPQSGLATTSGSSPLMDYCKDKGWQRISNVEDVKAGDIVFSGDTNSAKTTAAHTFICAGDNQRYDCGSVERIRLQGQYSSYKSQPFNESITNFVCAYRVTTGLGVDEVEGTNNFQGAIHLRRVMPDKAIGSMDNASTGVSTQKSKYVTADSKGLGTKEDIPDHVKNKMDGVSMNGISGTSYSDLSYLTIPYYDFDGKEQKGNMVVNKELADEVLLIFQELYNAKYPIEKMQPIEEMANKMSQVDFGDNENTNYGNKLDTTSLWYNNTSAFNDRNTSDGGQSKHATGCAIDLNPKINPYVNGSYYSPLNAEKYVNRKGKGWTDTEKKAIIDTDSQVYQVFKKYGWSWGGEDFGDVKDYQHFEKVDLSDVTKISSILPQSTEESTDTGTQDNNTSSGSTDNTTNNGGQNSNTQTAGNGKQYVIAIAAGHAINDAGAEGTTGDGRVLHEEQLTIKVAEYVEQLFSAYSNIKVVQTGSTSTNPDVSIGDRIPLAKQANADLCIQIHFNAGGGNYTMTYYKNGDTVSQQLADVVTNSISKSLGIETVGAQPDQSGYSDGKSYTIIAHSSEAGFPNIITEGAFIDTPAHQAIISTEEGLKKYAQGIVDGVLQYLDVANIGYGQTGTTSGTTEANAGIRSKIFDLKYVSKEKFEKDLEEKKEEVLKEFTIDDENRIVVATWSYNSDNGGVKFEKKTFQASSSYTQKYTMPFEYLLAYYIDTRNKEFVSDLAELAIDSEFVLAIQDNVSTTQTIVDVTEHQDIFIENNDGSSSHSIDRDISSTSTINESVSTTLELTYGDTWFMKFYKDVNYSSTDLSSSIAGTNSTLTGEEGSLIGDFKITAYCRWCNSPKNSLETAAGVDATPDHTIAVHEEYFDGQAVNGALKKGQQVMINGQVYTVEDTGDSNRLWKDNWIDIFIDGGSSPPASSSDDPCNFSPVNSESTPVYVANNVTEASKNANASKVAKNNRVNTVAIIKGNVNLSEMQSETKAVATISWENNHTRFHQVITTTTSTKVKSASYKYVNGETHVIGNEQKFITIYKKNNEFKNVLKPSWLFKVLATQSKTAGMIDLTKYLIYRASSQKENYGVTTFDFNQYAPQSFTAVGNGIYGNTIQEKVWFALKNLGLSDYAVAGAMGNIDYESAGFSPTAIEGGTGEGIGLCQWSYGRKQSLISYAQSKGKDWTDEDIQVQFLIGELTQGGGADGYASYELMTSSSKYDGISHSPNEWKDSTNVETSTKVFCYTFERPDTSAANSSMPQRISAAQKYYNEFQGKTAPSGDSRIGPISLSGASATNMINMLSQALQIADDDSYWYVWGAAHNGPSGWEGSTVPQNFDCSSFVGYLYYKHFGIYVGGDTEEMASQGASHQVPLSDIQPGDILYRYGHVGIALGNDQYVHASSSKNGIIVSSGAAGNFDKAIRYITN